ncbi:MAG: class I SAM-dependent methyltransferase, partial [Gammaproteobacteria bacterium]|nr:class I SAM-dependent methyltransferase [Gammaproteobacteria bacterium]
MFNDYENFSDQYAAVVDSKPIHRAYERPNTLSLLPQNLTNSTILDIGCGTGWYTEYLISQGAKVSAIDISKKMVELTRQRTNNKANCLKMNAVDLSKKFIAQEFDIILAPLVIHYLKDWDNLFKQFFYVLK